MKRSDHRQSLPEQTQVALQNLGDNLRVARKRRGDSLRVWAQRMDVSVPTVMRMERGDPSVSIGVYATAISLVDGLEAMARVASPETDHAAMAIDTARARQKGTRP